MHSQIFGGGSYSIKVLKDAQYMHINIHVYTRVSIHIEGKPYCMGLSLYMFLKIAFVPFIICFLSSSIPSRIFSCCSCCILWVLHIITVWLNSSRSSMYGSWLGMGDESSASLPPDSSSADDCGFCLCMHACMYGQIYRVVASRHCNLHRRMCKSFTLVFVDVHLCLCSFANTRVRTKCVWIADASSSSDVCR